MKPGSSEERENIRAMLRNAGLRSTASRVAVLERLRKASTPVTHAQVCEALSSLGFDRATVYRNLIDLTEAGLLTRTDVGDHVWRFEVRPEGAKHPAEHPHFVCADCGDVACLPGVSVRIRRTGGAPRALRHEGLEVQLKGLCDNCL